MLTLAFQNLSGGSYAPQWGLCPVGLSDECLAITFTVISVLRIRLA